MSRLTRAWPCALSAALLLLAFPPFNFSLIIFVALVPWLASIAKTDGRGAWKSGYAFGFLFGLGQLFFIAELTWRWTGSPLLALLPWLLASAAFALYFGWIGALVRRCLASNHLWIIPFVWAGVEALRSYVPTFAFPWGLLATPLWRFPALAQSGYFGQIFLVSGWVCAANIIVLVAVRQIDRPIKSRQFVAVTTGFVLVLALSLWRYSKPIIGQSVVISDIQPGVDMAFGDPTNTLFKLGAAIDPKLAEADSNGSVLAILPEGIVDGMYMPPRLPFSQPKVALLVGGRRGARPIYQSAFGHDANGWRYVDKTRLVVFGEFVPGRELFPFIAQTFQLPGSDISPGTRGVEAMDLGGVRLGPMVCFEAIFPEVANRQVSNGAQMLAVISIDDWYMGTNAPAELFGYSVWRSIETGLPLVRSASLGYTAVTDARGRVHAIAPLGQPELLRQAVVLPQSEHGFLLSALFAWVAGILSFGVTLAPLFSKRRMHPPLQA